ncbi:MULTISPECIES: heme biosynthesis HemY N-terminal domain-containing protein [Ramlibacter]|uniref:Heme biosynthesis protein HemY n=1 Tax=Ramlibacter aquaticus TaxID=2780094 RepID=A0ABR9SBR5_9BURK|nr:MULTISPECIES: heme biosynthesis HemY N-terminal domain-containing protein [Ramlibacter]MBE7939788.1 heme biosynthesis protein HemY [Ramlibacter aquaticus]
MRAALWLLALFAVAVAIALFAGNNQGTVTLFWPPWRLDLSVNLVVLLLVAGFAIVHFALAALSALFDIPRQALRWRVQQKERTMHGAMLDAVSHLIAGRFLRARKSAETALAQAHSLHAGGHAPGNAAQLRTLAHLLAAEASQSLQDHAARDEHLQQALAEGSARDAQETHEGALMRAARWSLDERDPDAAIGWLRMLPHGAARRTLALRMRLKAARLGRQVAEALEMARLLAKHRAFSPSAAQSILRGLAMDLLDGAHDPAQLLRAWSLLEPAERDMPDVAIHGAQRLATLGGDPQLARGWLLAAWEQQATLGDSQKVKLVRALEGVMDTLDAGWLARIESAQRADPRDATLQYLAGMACMKRQLWGKAQQLLGQAAMGLKDARMHRSAWSALAQLAEQRGDAQAAASYWKNAAGG